MVYNNLLTQAPCVGCLFEHNCFLHRASMNMYNEEVQYFIIHYQRKLFLLDNRTGLWRADFENIQNQIIEYYNSGDYEIVQYRIWGLTRDAQKEEDRKRIRKEFKTLIDIAAKKIEDKQPELSIALDGIGLMLISDYFEAVNKILSMFVKGMKIQNMRTENCSGYQIINGKG